MFYADLDALKDDGANWIWDTASSELEPVIAAPIFKHLTARAFAIHRNHILRAAQGEEGVPADIGDQHAMAGVLGPGADGDFAAIARQSVAWPDQCLLAIR